MAVGAAGVRAVHTLLRQIRDNWRSARPVSGAPRHNLTPRGASIMRFSWTGLLLAPLLAPLLFCLMMLGLIQPGGSAALIFLILLIPSCIISYGTTIFLFLPSLFLLSRRRPLTSLNTCLLGLVLGAAVFVPVTLLEWKSSGPDSGPPIESFWTFFVRWAADPLAAIYPVAGVMTAGLYWWLASAAWRRDAHASGFISLQ